MTGQSDQPVKSPCSLLTTMAVCICHKVTGNSGYLNVIKFQNAPFESTSPAPSLTWKQATHCALTNQTEWYARVCRLQHPTTRTKPLNSIPQLNYNFTSAPFQAVCRIGTSSPRKSLYTYIPKKCLHRQPQHNQYSAHSNYMQPAGYLC